MNLKKHVSWLLSFILAFSTVISDPSVFAEEEPVSDPENTVLIEEVPEETQSEEEIIEEESPSEEETVSEEI